jgi:hypothetical protein
VLGCRVFNWFSLCVTLSLAPWPLSAVEVYQWTDENGVVHFSQWAPTEPGKDVSTLVLDGNPPPGYNPEEDLYNVEANQKYMEALWSDLDARREAGKNQSGAGEQVIQQTVAPEYGVWPMYPYGQFPSNRPPHRPDRPVRPEQPIEMPTHSWEIKKRGG